MIKGFEEFQKVGKDGFDAYVRSFGEMNKGFQAIAAEVTDYSKKAFEDSTRVFEQLAGAKSFEQAVEIQSQYAKKAYDGYMAEVSKIGEMYAGIGQGRLQARGSRFQQEGRLAPLEGFYLSQDVKGSGALPGPFFCDSAHFLSATPL